MVLSMGITSAKKVMRLAFLALTVLLLSPAAMGQRCELTLEQSPELRGFKLGMTAARARVKLPGVTFPKPNENGEMRVFLPGTTLRRSDPVGTADVRGGLLTFFDGRLVFMTISYGDSVKWDSVDEFVFSISQALGLPPVWPKREARKEEFDDSEVYGAERDLECPGFTVMVKLDKVRSPPARISLIDNSFPELLTQRLREIEERKKSRFKP
jgi:hypothetical protein